MAIKGKKRARGRPRAVATAPRPFLVPPKTPPLRRRGVQIGLIVLFQGLVALVGWALNSAQDAAERRDAVERFATQVESALGATGVSTPLPGGPLILPELGQAMGQLASGEARERRIQADAEEWREQAREAADAVQRIRPGLPDLREARDEMVIALQLYASTARNVGLSVVLEGDERAQLLESLTEQLAAAAAVFDSGWKQLQEERRQAGIPTQTTPPGGAPPGGAPPGFPAPGLPAP
ncbi:MAG TPA: hypothetical protein VHL78_09925 [Actinomycetota bacterium]|nr:hypothetical protein [Actinomycetota bacterium]